MKRNREVKGFTLLELLVVLAIVALISAVGYPNFLSWSKDREVRQASEKLANSITSINTQTQRGWTGNVFQIIQNGRPRIRPVRQHSYTCYAATGIR